MRDQLVIHKSITGKVSLHKRSIVTFEIISTVDSMQYVDFPIVFNMLIINII